MEEKTKTVTKTTARVNEWNSGKGGFVAFEDDEADYFYFGPAKTYIGETAKFEVSPGTGNYSDKVKIEKKLETLSEGEVDVSGEPTKAELFESAAQDGLKVYIDKQNIIVAQTCLKVAGDVVSRLSAKNDGAAWKDVGKAVLEMADQFFIGVLQSQGEIQKRKGMK